MDADGGHRAGRDTVLDLTAATQRSQTWLRRCGARWLRSPIPASPATGTASPASGREHVRVDFGRRQGARRHESAWHRRSDRQSTAHRNAVAAPPLRTPGATSPSSRSIRWPLGRPSGAVGCTSSVNRRRRRRHLQHRRAARGEKDMTSGGERVKPRRSPPIRPPIGQRGDRPSAAGAVVGLTSFVIDPEDAGQRSARCRPSASTTCAPRWRRRRDDEHGPTARRHAVRFAHAAFLVDALEADAAPAVSSSTRCRRPTSTSSC